MEAHTAAVFVWILLLTPLAPIVLAWAIFARRPGRVNTGQLVPLIAVTASLAWLLASIRLPWLLAGDYGSWRFAIINGNFVLMVFAAVASFSRTSAVRIPVGIACCITTLLWSFVGAINAAV
jgi:hypothetical protein